MTKKKSDIPKVEPKAKVVLDAPLEELLKVIESVEWGCRNYGMTLPLFDKLRMHQAEVWKIVPPETAPLQPPYRCSLLNGKYCFAITQYFYTSVVTDDSWVPNHGAQSVDFCPKGTFDEKPVAEEPKDEEV